MATSNLMGNYLGRGTFAARPATPAIAANSTAMYYATDTIHLYIWNGSSWTLIF